MKFGPKLSLLYYPGSYTRDDLVFLCRQADRVAQFTQAIEIYKPSPLEWRARIKGQEDREALSETMTQPTQNAQALDTLLTAMEAKAKSTAGSLDTTA